MLIATRRQGGIQRNPNWVSTKPAPNPKVEARARKIAVVMRACRKSLGPRAKILLRPVLDNAEVPNRAFGKS
ncbi:MAG: hypothetical protein JO204_02060 [Alphaproteobacteria bacterium]|nr:hypothetical protein [Alphaproteobacteria bacterium]